MEFINRSYVQNFFKHIDKITRKALLEEDASTLLAIKTLTDEIGKVVQTALNEGYTADKGHTMTKNDDSIVVRVSASAPAHTTERIVLNPNLSDEDLKKLVTDGFAVHKTINYSERERTVTLALPKKKS